VKLVESLKRVVEKLRKDNAVLAKNAASATVFMKLKTDNERLRKEVAGLQAKVTEAESKLSAASAAAAMAMVDGKSAEAKAAAQVLALAGVDETKRELIRMTDALAACKKSQKKETDSSIDLKKRTPSLAVAAPTRFFLVL
jgi:hypothetical protein